MFVFDGHHADSRVQGARSEHRLDQLQGVKRGLDIPAVQWAQREAAGLVLLGWLPAATLC